MQLIIANWFRKFFAVSTLLEICEEKTTTKHVKPFFLFFDNKGLPDMHKRVIKDLLAELTPLSFTTEDPHFMIKSEIEKTTSEDSLIYRKKRGKCNFFHFFSSSSLFWRSNEY